MSAIWIYGDSYTSHYDHGTCWPKTVADNLKLEYINRAVSGGADETSIIRFHSDHNSIKSGDVVIFQLSTAGRLHVLFQRDRPETAAPYVHKVDTSLPQHRWYQENQAHIEWSLVNQDCHVKQLNQLAYIGVLSHFARTNPTVTVVVLQNQRVLPQFPMDHPPNFIRSTVNLFDISQAEYQQAMSYTEWVKYTKYDPRNNHLTEANGLILGAAVTQMIQQQTSGPLTPGIFRRAILPQIRTRHQYDSLVVSGLLRHTSIRDSLP